MMRVNLMVNGTAVSADVEPRLQLADFLREHCLLTGTHIGCEHGVCGACTVLLDGAPARSCIAYAAACDGAEVSTVEGLEDDPIMQHLRAAFTAEHALQCGYCTPGMLVTARDIVLRLPDADAARIRLELAGNLCRCTGYAGIVRAISRVLREDVPRPEPAHAPMPRIETLPPLAATPPPSTQPAPPFAASPAVVLPGVDASIDAASPAEPSLWFTLRLACPLADVWTALHDPTLLATCVPGARLTEASDGHLSGELQVALGPITALFSGSGRLQLDAAAHRATLSGEGSDRRSATRLSGNATITLSAAGDAATDAALAVTYALRGPLAQLARGPVVQQFAAGIAETVARNLERRLAGEAAAPAPARLSMMGLLLQIAWRRLRRWLHLT